MNKKTVLIKNYVLSTDVVYLDYNNSEEGTNHRFNNKQTIIDYPEVFFIKNNEENGNGICTR